MTMTMPTSKGAPSVEVRTLCPRLPSHFLAMINYGRSEAVGTIRVCRVPVFGDTPGDVLLAVRRDPLSGLNLIVQ